MNWSNKHSIGGIFVVLMYFIFVFLVIFSLSINNFRVELKSQLVSAKEYLKEDMFIIHVCDIGGGEGIKSVLDSEAKVVLDRNGNLVTAIRPYIPELVELPCIRRSDSIIEAPTAFEVLLKHRSKKQIIDKELSKTKEKIFDLSKTVSISEINIKEMREKVAMERTIDPDEDTENLDIRNSLKELEFVKGNLKFEESRLKTLKAEFSYWEVQGEKIDTIVEESKFMEFFGFGKNNTFWATNPILLSLILMMSMGGLGSLITLTAEHLATPKKGYRAGQLSKYFFRPMLGTIVALALYISLKSGQISVSSDVGSEFSPFYLSFFGILSGLMSEHIYKKMISVGKIYLGDEND